MECCLFEPLIGPCPCCDGAMSWGFMSPELFDRVVYQPGVPGVGDLVVAYVRFDVPGQFSSVGGDSVRAVSPLMAADVTDAGNRFHLTAAQLVAGGYGCSGWL